MLLAKFCAEHVVKTCKELGDEAKINEFCLGLNLSLHPCSKCGKSTYTIQTDKYSNCALCGSNK